MTERHSERENAPSRLLFYTLQGLGNSLLNVPAFLSLRRLHDIQVVCFNNGTSAFFRAFHKDVLGLDSRLELLKRARSLSADSTYVSFPTWKKELSTVLLTRSGKRYFLRPPGGVLTPWLLPNAPSADPNLHDLENNVHLAQAICGDSETGLDVVGALGLRDVSETQDRVLAVHPTASSVYKYYPFSFWKSLLEKLAPDFDRIEMFCANKPAETTFCDEIREALAAQIRARTEVFKGLPFDQLTRRLYAAAHFVGSDSALMHLTALLDRPVLGLWSFANHRIIYPYGNASSVYMPSETLTARRHEYPNSVPPYMARADALRAARIVKGAEEENFELKPLFKNAVRFYTF